MPERLATRLPACTVDAALHGRVGDLCSSCLARKFTGCHGVEDTVVDALSRAVTRKTFRPHETILAEGDPANVVGIIRSGAAAVVKYAEDGRRQICGFLDEGDVFGIAPGEAFHASVEALGATTACFFPKAVFEAAMERHPRLSANLVRIVSNEMAETAEHQLLLGRYSGRERLAAFLMRRGTRFGRSLDAPCEFRLEMTRQDIADYLGLSMENVSRGLHDLVRSGLIEIPSPRRILLKNIAGLSALAPA